MDNFSFEYKGLQVNFVLPGGGDHISSSVLKNKTFYELELLEALGKLLRPGDLVVDAGANIGNHTVYFAHVLGCRVVAFEPIASTFAYLKQNVAINKLESKVELHNFAVGAESGHAVIERYDAANIGGTTLLVDEAGEIAVKPIDEVMLGHPVRMIKIDVEGMEADVLRGAESLIAKQRPWIICEAQTADAYREIGSVLDKHGYIPTACYNATDTFIFLPNASKSEREAVARHGFEQIIDLQRESRRLAGDISRSDRYSERLAREARQQLSADIGSSAAAIKEQLSAEISSSAAEVTLQLNTKIDSSAAKVRQQLSSELDLTLAGLRQEFDGGIASSVATVTQQVGREIVSSVAELRQKVSGEIVSTADSIRQKLEADIACVSLDVSNEMGNIGKLFDEKLEACMNELDGMRIADAERVYELLAKLDENWQSTLSEAVEALGREVAHQVDSIHELSLRLIDREREVGNLKGQLSDGMRQLHEAKSGLESARGRIAELQAALASAESRGDSLKKHADASGVALRDLTAALQQLKTTCATLQNDNGELWATLTDAIKCIEVQFERLTSVSNQAGRAFAMATHSGKDMAKLPVRLYRLYREMRRRRAGLGSREVIPVGSNDAGAIIERAREIVQSQVEPLRELDMGGGHVGIDKSSAHDSGTAHVVPRLPAAPGDVSSVKMAVIMDEFTFSSYKDCCQLRQLSMAEWREELELFQPDLLFIESAWRGKDGQWAGRVNHCCDELEDIIQWCRQRRIPTAFWNKEDPVHFEGFLATARRFDYVFTTDIECISRYKAALGHDRVYLLPFACQPSVHNPIEKFERQDAFCFAGAYYARYPERQKDFDVFLDSLARVSKVEIYDRNFGKDDPQFKFPDRYQHLIIGNLPFDQIDLAYKGYRYAINLNSVKQSQTMFARRVFDLLGCNTVTVSNYSPGLRLMFGDLVVTTDSGDELVRRLRPLLEDDASFRRFRLAGLRKVMSEHTYQDRLAYVMSKVSGAKVEPSLPEVVVIAQVRSEGDLEQVLKYYRTQTWSRKRLALVLAAPDLARRVPRGSDVSVFGIEDARAVDPSVRWPGALLAGWSCNDYYGPNYLADLALAKRYNNAPALGKRAFYEANGREVRLVDGGVRYVPCDSLDIRSSLIAGDAAPQNLAEFAKQIDEAVFVGDSLALDEFNYVRGGAGGEWPVVDDLEGLQPGVALAEILDRAERIERASFEVDPNFARIDAAQLAELFGDQRADCVSLQVGDGGLAVTSQLPFHKHHYFYAKKNIPLDWWSRTELRFNLDLRPGVSIELAILFLDASGQRVGTHINAAGRNHTVAVPENAESIKLGLRIKGVGTASVSTLYMDHLPLRSGAAIARSKHLVLTNHYPSYEHLYRNGFVHRRVVGYRQLGLSTEVFCLSPNGQKYVHEFENVDVRGGDADELRQLLEDNRFESILVHFLDEAMWSVLRDYIDTVRVIVWVHGSEIQPWYRRDFNYTNDEQRQAAMVVSDSRMKFWREVFSLCPPNLQFVFVSKYFAEEVMEDVGIKLDASRYEIIHNYIDEELFSYKRKDPEQRHKVLSIRPFASAKYANDLSVKAILELSKHPLFERMSFHILGDGALFDEALQPLLELKNVRIERRFLSQGEIAELHKQYGLFLSPTRMDSQGVSRDEAMASGLVPVTNAVTAIPEFVDEACGILAPGEDWSAMAQGILRIVQDPAQFERLSSNAAKRVRSQSGFDSTIRREAALISLRGLAAEPDGPTVMFSGD